MTMFRWTVWDVKWAADCLGVPNVARLMESSLIRESDIVGRTQQGAGVRRRFCLPVQSRSSNWRQLWPLSRSASVSINLCHCDPR